MQAGQNPFTERSARRAAHKVNQPIRIPYQQMQQEFTRVLGKNGLDSERAHRCATIFAENSLVGVASHGLNRFPGLIDFIQKGYVNPQADVEKSPAQGLGSNGMAIWALGPLNAYACTERAMALAKEHGVGCVGLRNTNHWMRRLLRLDGRGSRFCPDQLDQHQAQYAGVGRH